MIPMGVQTHTGELSMEELIAYAQRAEELGYHALFPTENSGRDAMAVLGAIAARTKTLTMATGIVSVYTRTPTLIAMGVAALDGFGCREYPLGVQAAGEGAALELDVGLAGGDPARLGDTDLDLDIGARSRAGGAEHFVPGHRHLDRALRFLR